MAIIASSAAISAQNAQNAQRAAEQVECRAILRTYQPVDASVDVMRGYAHCVYLLHGDGVPMTESETLWVKLLLVAVIISAAIGAWIAYRDEGDPVFALLGLLMGPCVLAVILGVGAGLFYSVRFILGA
jgi:hypothetical protein